MRGPYSLTNVFDGDELGVARFRPALESILQYDPVDRKLQSYVKGGFKVRQVVEDGFGVAILGKPLGPPPKRDFNYNLTRLLPDLFDFFQSDDDGIEYAVLRTLRLKARKSPARWVTFEAGADALDEERDGVWKLARILIDAKPDLIDDFAVQMAEIEFVFTADKSGKSRRRKVRVSQSSCTRHGDSSDDVVTKCLQRWGLCIPISQG